MVSEGDIYTNAHVSILVHAVDRCLGLFSPTQMFIYICYILEYIGYIYRVCPYVLYLCMAAVCTV